VLRGLATVVAVVALAACSGPAGGSASSTPTASGARSSGLAENRAAGLRARLDLLLGGHVMLLARTADAALGVRTEEFAGFGRMAHENGAAIASELQDLSGSAQSGQRASAALDLFDSSFVDYVTAAYKRDANAQNAAIQALTTSYVGQMADLLAGFTGLSPDQLSQMLTQQVQTGRAVVDAEAMGGDWKTAYGDVRAAYAQTMAMGDALAAAVARRQSGRYPGDPSSRAATLQTRLETLLQEQVHLAGMAASAAAGNRQDELQAARDALKASQDDAGSALAALGSDDQARASQALAGLETSVQDTASAVAAKDPTAQQQAETRLTDGFPTAFYPLGTDGGLTLQQSLTLSRSLGQSMRDLAETEGARNYTTGPATVRDAAGAATALGSSWSAAIARKYPDQFR
jgi:hypothetical protein